MPPGRVALTPAMHSQLLHWPQAALELALRKIAPALQATANGDDVLSMSASSGNY
jgi:hypothetical protein